MVNWKEVNKKITNDRMNYYTWWERQIEDRLGITITQAAVRELKKNVLEHLLQDRESVQCNELFATDR